MANVDTDMSLQVCVYVPAVNDLDRPVKILVAGQNSFNPTGY